MNTDYIRSSTGGMSNKITHESNGSVTASVDRLAGPETINRFNN